MDIGEYLRAQLKDSINQQFHIEGDIWLVPCVANYSENDFKPLMQPLTCNKVQDAQSNRQGWSALEDEILFKIVSSRGAKAWSGIAKELNAMIHEGNSVRQGRHCRERWFNHIDPGLVKGNWSEQEDEFIFSQFNEIGSRWSEISKKMKGRTENSVKNRFKSLLRKKGISEEDFEKECKAQRDGKERMKDEVMILRNRIDENTSGLDCLLLMSPQIVNFDITDNVEPVVEKRFFVPKTVEIRPITQKLPGIRQITSTKEMLRRDALPEGTPSPSIFLR